MRFRFPDLPEWESDALFIRPPWLVHNARVRLSRLYVWSVWRWGGEGQGRLLPKLMRTLKIYWLLEVYILTTSKVISGRVPICEWAHSSNFIVLLHWGYEVSGTMTQYPTQSHYPDTGWTYPFPILLMQSTWLGSDKYKLLCYWFDSPRVRTNMVRIPDLPNRDTDALRIQSYTDLQ